MNAIQYALNHIRHTIPEGILQLAFSPRSIVQPTVRWNQNNEFVSIDQQIRDKVIEGRVNIDCNLIGSMQIAIDLNGVPYEQFDMATRVFRIPYEKTGGRRIVSIQTLNYMNYHGMGGYDSYGGFGGVDQRLGAAMDLYRAVANMPIVASANCQLIGDNTVMVKDNIQHLSDNLAMTCLIENDSEMNNLNPGIFPVYAKLVELATKAYIYTQTIIPMDQGVLHGGMSLGRISDIIQDYADSNEMYEQVFREQYRKASFTNDRPRMHNFINSMIGRGS
jgi:hypothetical protein